MKRLGLLTVLTLICSACSPVKGYPGPELPPEQLSLVERTQDSSRKFLDSRADNIPFTGNGILVQPGKHSFQMTVSIEGDDKDCSHFEETNEYQYEECLKSQEKAIKKDAAVIPDCDIDNYTTTKRSCIVPFVDYTCQGSSSLLVGCQYNLQIYSSYSSKNVSVSLDQIKGPGGVDVRKNIASWKCKYLGERTEEQID